MTLDAYWDKPEFTPATLNRLKTERNKLSLDLSLNKSAQDSIWHKEQALKLQLRELEQKRYGLRATEDSIKLDYTKLGTIELTFAEEMRKAQALAELEGKISALEEKLRGLSEGRDFWDKLMPFQKDDLLYTINAWDLGLSGVLNANSMGLGKTFETVAFDFLAGKLFQEKFDRTPRRIWVTKKSLIKSTCRELKKWFDDTKIIPMVGKNTAERNALVNFAHQSNSMLVCNYESLTTTPLINSVDYDFIYMDEVHKLKGGASSTPTQLWKSARDLVFKSRDNGHSFYLPLSGSPVQNKPSEMYAYLHLFDPIKFESLRAFERTYCAGYKEGIRINPEFLIRAMKSQIIRRTVPEVRDQLATTLKDPVIDIREVELTEPQRKIYDMMRNEFFVWLDDQKETVLTATVILAQLTRLRQIALWPDTVVNRPVGSGKVDEIMDIIEELTEQDEQVVVFSSQFNEPLHEIYNRCTKFLEIPTEMVVGATKDVDDVCEKFRQGEIKVLCINAKTGSEGLNLQKSDAWPGGASHVIMADLWYNPESNNQAIARCWRQGQTDVVTVHHIHAVDTVDNWIDSLLEEKTHMIGSIMSKTELRKGKADWRAALDGMV